MRTRFLAIRLDLDMHIFPAEGLTLIVTSFIARLLHAAKTILELPFLTDAMMAQVQLPGSLEGLSLTNPFIKLQVAHLASLAGPLETHLPLAPVEGSQ